MNSHSLYMGRAIELATLAFPECLPNPGVGAVIVYNDHIIGEGYTQAYGGSHAEVMAIESVKEQELLKQATIYVTLEPCNHTGKTPPCTLAIKNSGIREVIIASRDPFENKAGGGIKYLKSNGISVSEGISELQSKSLNKRFFTYQEKKRPYVILKWAKSKDGFIAPNDKKNEHGIYWITQPKTRQLTHKWRSEEMAILIGKNTALLDNPKLTVRDVLGKNPIRILIDSELEVKQDANIFNAEASTYIFNSVYNSSKDHLHWIKIDFKKNVPEQVLSILFEMNIQSLIVEGGAKTINSFIKKGLWDEATIFTGIDNLESGLATPELFGDIVCSKHIGKDFLEIVLNNSAKEKETL